MSPVLAEKPLPAKRQAAQLKPLSPVPVNKVYKLTLQIGTNVRFMNALPGTWERIEPRHDQMDQRRSQQEFQAEYKPNIWISPPLSGKTVNGVISIHNAWLEANTHLAGGGAPATLNRQLVILEMEETDEPAEDRKKSFTMGRDAMKEMITEAVGAAVKATTDSFLAAQSKNKG
jgi:hypothetical protein